MPGLGKTTLARKLYNDSNITFEFVRRCLIVLDDVWNAVIVDFITCVFPDNNKGHKIMMASRFVEVTSYFNRDIYKLSFLTDEDSWFLLKLKVFRKKCCPPELAEIGSNIAKKCNGLPLAVVVIAGALLGRTTRREWQLVDENMGEYLINRDVPDSCFRLIKMSYDLLSYFQQACFLYCASFPQGFDIPAWKLIRLWIAEGFIPIQNHLTLEEQAEECLNDLTKKNLLMVMEESLDGQIKTCREFCKKEPIEEDIVWAIKNAPDEESLVTKDSGTYRRLCIDSSTLSNFLKELRKEPPMENVKSFLCFSSNPIDNQTPDMIKSLHKGFPLIKVLDVEPLRSIGFIVC
ncbi:toMV resistant protein Tm-2 netted virescent-like isoform X2 [Capsicum chacoense]